MTIARKDPMDVIELQMISSDANVDDPHDLWYEGLNSSPRERGSTW